MLISFCTSLKIQCPLLIYSLEGWAYNELTVTTSARELAIQIQETFLSSLQGSDSHRAPKTLALTDTAMFDPFIAAWEELMAAMTTILQADNDPDFFGNLHRARATAVSFPGALDDPSFKIKAASKFVCVYSHSPCDSWCWPSDDLHCTFRSGHW